MIKVILWDIDGTLLDFRPAECHALLSSFEKICPGECTDAMLEDYSAINRKYWEALERKEITKAEVLVQRFEEFFGKYGIDTALAKPFNAEYQVRLGDEVHFFPKAKETVEALKQAGIRQYAVTNGTKVAQDIKLKRSGLDQLFDGIYISEVAGYDKPDKRFFQKVFQEIGNYDKGEIIIVGDSLTGDMRGGNNAGIHTCWFNPQGLEKHVTVVTEHEIKSIDEVLSVIQKY